MLPCASGENGPNFIPSANFIIFQLLVNFKVLLLSPSGAENKVLQIKSGIVPRLTKACANGENGPNYTPSANSIIFQPSISSKDPSK
jgi:hypothetical protein